jgi:phenylacetate-CoA ligase
MRTEDIKRIQRDKFSSLMERIKRSPLYANKLSDHGLREVTLESIGHLPFTIKEELRTAGAFGNLAVDKKDICEYHESFGTTGTPTSTWFTREDLATGGRQMNLTGVGLASDDLVLIRFPYAISLPAHLMQQAAWQAGAGVVPASSRNTITPYPRVLKLLQKLQVTVIAGLPSEMEWLAETARLLGLDSSKDFPHLRAICVAGELLSDKRRDHIQKLWNASVYNMYGSTETANIAAMCEHGSLHITEEDFYIEALKTDLSGPVKPGEKGMAAVTSLSHQGSPLLRYLNEDVISITREACPCGDERKVMIHYGRLKDRAVIDGKVLDAKEIHEAVYSLHPAPVAWKAQIGDNGIHLLLDSHHSGDWESESAEKILTEQLKVPVTLEIVEDGILFDRSQLLHISASKKPDYIEPIRP